MALVVIGNFDGVHRGHQALLAGAVREAEEAGMPTRLLTFWPHPAEVLGRARPPLLTAPARKRELVGRAFPSVEYVQHTFDKAFAETSPEDFAAWLRAELDAQRVVVGQNFRFGKNRAGGFDDLVRLGATLGFVPRSAPLVGDEAGPWSSTRVRAAVASGDVAGAERMLGRPHTLIGEVAPGKRLGRTLGFPTANLSGWVEMLPPMGVYAVVVDRTTSEGPLAVGLGAMSVGTNPTTDATSDVKVEVHVLDFDGDLYGQELRVGLVERLRGEALFEDLDALVRQMKEDVAGARRALAGRTRYAGPGG